MCSLPIRSHPLNHLRLVTVEYFKAHYTDITILDASTGSVLDSKDLFTYVAAGTMSYTLQLLARAEPGVWKLQASVRSWWHNAWCLNPTEGAYLFEVDILKVSWCGHPNLNRHGREAVFRSRVIWRARRDLNPTGFKSSTNRFKLELSPKSPSNVNRNRIVALLT